MRSRASSASPCRSATIHASRGQKGWQGTAEIRLQIGADGKVKNVLVGRSSGYELLDQRAVELVKQMRLPNVPSAFRAREFTVTVPITFALKNS